MVEGCGGETRRVAAPGAAAISSPVAVALVAAVAAAPAVETRAIAEESSAGATVAAGIATDRDGEGAAPIRSSRVGIAIACSASVSREAVAVVLTVAAGTSLGK